MIEDLKNKVVLITGSSTGIGAAAAIAFGQNGAKVAVHYNKSKTEAEKVAAQVEKAGGKALLVGGDVTDSAICKQIVDRTVAGFGRIDVLINNAGGLVQRAPIESITGELFDQAVPVMRTRPGLTQLPGVAITDFTFRSVTGTSSEAATAAPGSTWCVGCR